MPTSNNWMSDVEKNDTIFYMPLCVWILFTPKLLIIDALDDLRSFLVYWLDFLLDTNRFLLDCSIKGKHP